ncbi:MFS transporter [Amnibacterium endophyticum]|uniref:MFS transporter n=1 Tax=Amnibacterium endophyticum TaxID=2109337 RepID=A0ABW4LAK7_9MICO
MTAVEQYSMPLALRIRLGLLAACLFVVATNGFVIAGLLPEVAADLGVTPQAVGGSISVYAVVVAVLAPVASVALARVPRVAVLAGGILLVGAGTAVAVAAPGYGLFLAGRVLAAVGGAALVPAATAPAPTLLPPELRGRALAIAGLGFTLATAVGSPLGTALASVGGWRSALGVLAGAALVLAAAVAATVRGLPEPAVVPFAARLVPLRDARIALPLVSVVFVTASFNIVYIYSAAVTRQATGGDGRLLAVLLLVYGVFGVAGTALAGRLTDRHGAGRVAAVAFTGEAVVLVALSLLGASFALDVAVFALWGLAAFAITVPVQHRLVAVDPAAAGVVLAWFSTAMYAGIGLAPVVGGAALASSAALVPLAGAAAAVLGLAVFALGFRARGPVVSA